MKKEKKSKKEKKEKKTVLSPISNKNKMIESTLNQKKISTAKLQKNLFLSINQSLTQFSDELNYEKQIEKRSEEKKKESSNLHCNYRVPTGFSVPDFLNGQKQSFKNFLTYGLVQELNLYGWFSMRLEDISSNWAFYNPKQEFIKMPLDNSIDVLFHGEYYKLIKPKLSPRKAILSRETYSSQLYVPIQINLHWTREVFVHWFLLANLPMMTKKGHFIINGIPRVILNQIIRRPGIYFKTIEKKKSSIYVADIIAQRGTWLRLEIVRNRTNPSTGKIWAKLKKLKRFPVSLLVSDLGLSQAFFDNYLKSTSLVSRFKQDTIFQNTFSDKVAKVESFLKPQVKKWVARLNSRKGYFRKKFSNPYAYSLSQSGRQSLNQTLGLNLPINHITLTGEDVLLGCCQLIDFFHGSQKPSDIDDLKNRKLRPTGELIQDQLGVGLLQLREKVLETLNKQTDKTGALWKNREIKQHYGERKAYVQNLISNAPVNTVLKSFFATNPLSQFLDQTNALSELTHKRRISSLGEGGIQRDTATMAVRGIHPSHYGRICPIETPEGQNAGLVNSFTTYAKLNSLGLIETPFYTVHKGMVLKERATMFSSEQEKNFVIAPGDVSITKDHCLLPKKQPVRQADSFNRVLPSQINFMAVGPLQMISIATSLIPFLEHDDGNRALMGSNMQRQAVPTLIAAAPIVGTGFESRVLSDSCVGIQAKSSGFVSYVDNQKIVLYSSCLTKTQMLRTKFKLTRLTKQKFKLKSIEVQKQLISFMKPVSKINLFDHQNKNNQINLNQMQLYTHFDLIQHHACFSLWLIFSNIARQSIVKKRIFSPVLTQTALVVLQQTYNAHYFNHYCILLLHQIFSAGSSKTSQCNQLLNSNDLKPVLNFMFSKTKSNSKQNLKRLLKNKTKPCYKKVSRFTPQSTIKTIITPYTKGPTEKRLKATLNHQSKITASPNLKSFSAFYHSNNTLKTSWSSKIIEKNLNKIVNSDFEADAFTKPIFSNGLAQMFYMPLFESNSPFDSKLNHSNLTTISESKPELKQNSVNALKQKVMPTKTLVPNQYNLLPYFRSNQDTPLAQKPLVSEGQWVQQGDALTDTRSSLNGELAIGQNLLVGYTPWEGYNFEDAVLLNQRVISEDLLTTLHIERYEININDTRYGPEFIPNELQLSNEYPEIDQENALYLESGIIKVGTWVQENMLLVRKFTPIEEPVISTYERLAHKVLQTSELGIRDTSVRVPANVHGRVIHVEIKDTFNEKSSLKKAKKAKKTKKTEKTEKIKKIEKQKPNLLPKRLGFKKRNLQKQKNFEFELNSQANQDAFLNKVYNRSQMSDNRHSWSKSFELKKTEKRKKIEKEIAFLSKKPTKVLKRIKLFSKKKKRDFRKVSTENISKLSVRKVEIYIAEQRKVQVGDKIAGRHGNKGIISAILPREDMPYLPDGSVLDVVLNPLGVPSRMNVGQIFECLLGLAGSYLNQVYKIQPFDETYGIEASRSLVYSKLYEARLKTNQSWLFNPNYPGKVRLFDGRTGQCFAQPVTVGKAYILKLIHLVDEKIHARSTGPYSVVTQQPLRGRSKQGGQRVGEMEVWAFEGFGAAYILQELLTIKSDDMENRTNINYNILNNEPFTYGLPESFNVLMNELKCLCLNTIVGKYRKLPLIDSGLTLINKTALRKPTKQWPFT